jgi:hypothetical protein
MSEAAERVERELVRDLATLGGHIADEEFCFELYRALANNAWRKEAGPGGEASLSWAGASNEWERRAHEAGRYRLPPPSSG